MVIGVKKCSNFATITMKDCTNAVPDSCKGQINKRCGRSDGIWLELFIIGLYLLSFIYRFGDVDPPSSSPNQQCSNFATNVIFLVYKNGRGNRHASMESIF